MRKKIEEEVMTKVSAQFSSEWAKKEVVLTKELAGTKAALK